MVVLVRRPAHLKLVAIDLCECLVIRVSLVKVHFIHVYLFFKQALLFQLLSLFLLALQLNLHFEGQQRWLLDGKGAHKLLEIVELFDLPSRRLLLFARFLSTLILCVVQY